MDKKQNKEVTFSTWNTRVKKLFYEEYTKQGGEMEMKKWSKTSWLNKKPVLPNEIGRVRVAHQLQALLFNL